MVRSASLILAAAAFASAIEPPPLGLDAYVPSPPDNPLSDEGVGLGRRLFFDKRLSRDESISCATCHDPEHGFTDARPRAIGVGGQLGQRRSPTLINRAYGKAFFWDGRAATLEEQVLQPIQNPVEMALPLDQLRARTGFDPQQVAHALASYVRSLLAGDSPYDRFVAGNAEALDEAQHRGLKVFRGKGNCIACHVGPNLTDEAFHNTGIGWNGQAFADGGRGNGEFKTPTLRELTRRAPYMHDGSLGTLAEVIDYYDRGGRANPHLDVEIQPLRLSDLEKRDLIAFLQSLTGKLRR
jgi:cytochrome c peroxidase